MAPLPFDIIPRVTKGSYGGYHPHSSSGSGGDIGGGVIATIIAIVIIIFICVVIYEYRKAARRREQKGVPIKWSSILKKAALISCTFGIAACCCAECFSDGDTDDVGNASGGGGGGGGGAFVQTPIAMAPQMSVPSWQPTMDNTPIESAAVAPVQG